MKKFLLCGALILLASVWVYSQQVSLKVTGGMYFNFGNDYNKGIEGYNNYLNDEFTSVSGEFEKFSKALNFQGELIFHFNPNMAIGLGGGYLQWSKNNLVEPDWGGAIEEITYAPKLSVISVFANFHYMTPIAPKLNIDLYAGPGLYLTKFDWEDSDVLSGVWDLTHTFSSSSTAFGFQAGLGLSFELAPNISLVVDGFYRYAKIPELKGTWTEEGYVLWMSGENSYDNSYLWYYEDNSSGTRYSRVILGLDKPSGSGISGARKAEISLSGITGIAGLKFSF
jgi:opacity protein-like surface antigen